MQQHHMKFLTSAPNVRGQLAPLGPDLAFLIP